MSVEIADLIRIDELDAGPAGPVAERDLSAMRAIADWIRTFVVQPHKDLGRSGTVCPYMPAVLERRKLWFAPEDVADRDASEVAEIMQGHRRRFLDMQPTGSEDASRAAIIVVFPDLPADRAKPLFDDVLARIAAPAYDEDGIIFGPYYDGHQGTAIYNPEFHPFQSPVPVMFVRHGVVDDWKFFIDDDQLLGRFAHRFGEPAVHALAEELHRHPWRVARD